MNQRNLYTKRWSEKKIYGERILLIILSIYFFLGKLSLYTKLRISMDYLFWIVISAFLVIEMLFSRWNKRRIHFFPVFLYLAYQLFEVFNSSYREIAISVFVFNVITMCVFTYFIGKKGIENNFFHYLHIGGLFFSITIILQAMIPNVINSIRLNMLSYADYAISQRGYENTTHYLAGLAPNVAVAAFFVAMMTSQSVAKVLLKQQTSKNVIISAVGLLAILLTQKRSFAIGMILAVGIVVLLFNRSLEKKIKYILIGTIIGGIALYCLYLYLPAMTILINRIFHNDNALSGRELYYDQMKQWISEHIMIGKGIGTCNAVFGVGGHNCYLQLLAETGIIGCTIYAYLVIPYIYNTGKLLRKCWNDPVGIKENPKKAVCLLTTGIAITVILIYAFFGNPFYDYTFCLTFFMLLAVSTQMYEGGGDNNESQI